MNCSTPGFSVHHYIPEFAQTYVHWVSDAIQPSHLLSSPSLPAFNLSQHRCLFNESALRIRCLNYWSFSFSINPSSEFSSVQSLSRVQLFATPWTTGCQASLSITNYQSLPKLMSVESVIPSNHLIFCHPFLLLPSIFPSVRVFSPVSQLFASGGQSIGVSASTSVLPMNIQDWSALGWISLQSKGLSRVFFNTTVQKHQFFGAQPSSQSNSHIHTGYWKNRSLD